MRKHFDSETRQAPQSDRFWIFSLFKRQRWYVGCVGTNNSICSTTRFTSNFCMGFVECWCHSFCYVETTSPFSLKPTLDWANGGHCEDSQKSWKWFLFLSSSFLWKKYFLDLNWSWILTLWFFLEQVFDILMSLWELDFRRRKLIVDLMSESPWLRETQEQDRQSEQQQQRERKGTMTAPTPTPSSFSKPHSVRYSSSCSSLMSFPPFLELPPPDVSSSCTPPNCFGGEDSPYSLPQTASSPRSFILFESTSPGRSASERFFLFLSFFIAFLSFPPFSLFDFFSCSFSIFDLFEFIFDCLEIDLRGSSKL